MFWFTYFVEIPKINISNNVYANVTDDSMDLKNVQEPRETNANEVHNNQHATKPAKNIFKLKINMIIQSWLQQVIPSNRQVWHHIKYIPVRT